MGLPVTFGVAWRGTVWCGITWHIRYGTAWNRSLWHCLQHFGTAQPSTARPGPAAGATPASPPRPANYNSRQPARCREGPLPPSARRPSAAAAARPPARPQRGARSRRRPHPPPPGRSRPPAAARPGPAAMSAQAQMRALLDQLMGTARDGEWGRAGPAGDAAARPGAAPPPLRAPSPGPSPERRGRGLRLAPGPAPREPPLQPGGPPAACWARCRAVRYSALGFLSEAVPLLARSLSLSAC